MGRVWRVIATAVALIVATIAPAAAAPVHRIVAVGDLHGDFAAWRAIAQGAGLIDAKGHWAGGASVLVQTGDVVDRGPDSRRIVEDLIRLQREAARAGGRLIALVGNHEAMNMTGDLRYVSAADFAAYADAHSAAARDEVYAANRAAIEAAYRKRDPAMTAEAARAAWIAATPLGWVEHHHAWGPDGAIGRWEVGNPAVLLLDGTLFVHGGVSAAYASIPIATINARVADALRARDTADTAIINDPAGPLWYRGLAAAPDKPIPAAVEDELDQVLRATGARRMVIAHTPWLAGVAILADGRLIRIDTGISAVFGGALGYLEILDGTPVAHAVPRPAPTAEAATRGGTK